MRLTSYRGTDTLIKKKRHVFLPVYQLLIVDQSICWRCRTASVCGWMWLLGVEVGGDLLRPDGRCDQACFSASPLAPIGVTMLHLACGSSLGRDRNHSRGGGSFYESGQRWRLQFYSYYNRRGFLFCVCTVFKVIWQSVYLSIPSETGCIKSDLYFWDMVSYLK